MRTVLIVLAGLTLVGCNECNQGEEHCDGNVAQYCPGSYCGGNRWANFPEHSNCAEVSGCRCVMQGSSAVCVAPSGSPAACPVPSCSGGSSMAVVAASWWLARG